MKKLLLTAVTATLVSLAAHAQTKATHSASSTVNRFAVLDAKYGFRDLKFETDSTNIRGLVPLEGDTGLAIRPDDELTFGDAQADAIWYKFYKGQFSQVTIRTSGAANALFLLQAAEKQYGKGDKASTGPHDFQWKGNKGFMLYQVEAATGNANLIVFSRILFNREMDAWRAGRAGREAKESQRSTGL